MADPILIEGFTKDPHDVGHSSNCKVADWWLDRLIEEVADLDPGEPLTETHLATDDVACILAELRRRRDTDG